MHRWEIRLTAITFVRPILELFELWMFWKHSELKQLQDRSCRSIIKLLFSLICSVLASGNSAVRDKGAQAEIDRHMLTVMISCGWIKVLFGTSSFFLETCACVVWLQFSRSKTQVGTCQNDFFLLRPESPSIALSNLTIWHHSWNTVPFLLRTRHTLRPWKTVQAF